MRFDIDISFIKSRFLRILIILLIFVVMIGLSWAITCGIIKLICLCFGLKFSLFIATGIWLILILINGFFNQ